MQWIIFIDPKGLRNLSLEDEKLNLHNHLGNVIQPKINEPNIKLDAFIVSVTPYNDFQEQHPTIPIEEYEKRHLLFQEIRESVPNDTYMPKLFEMAINEN